MITESEALQRVVPYLISPDPGENQPDPADLGEASDYNGLSPYVALLQQGMDGEHVRELMPAELKAKLALVSADIPEPEAPDLDSYEIPALPQGVMLPESVARGASPWLDAYTAFSRKWSPRAYDGFHEACGLWLLSTVAARRVVLHLGGERFTSLYIALVARTSLWAKSTTAKVAQDTLRVAGLDWLLAGDATPQKFIADLTGKVPSGFDTLPSDLQERIRLRLAFPAQRGWFFDEFGQKLHAMLAPNGFMADFRGILRRLDDCPNEYEYSTVTRGTDLVRRPYLALLANMTPADLRNAARRNDALWGDGFWARFALVTPPPGTNSGLERFPDDVRVIPSNLSTPLREWHDRLGTPDVEIEDILGDNEKPTGQKRVHVHSVGDPKPCKMGAEVKEAFYSYHDGLSSVAASSETEDLDGNYLRFAEKALRVSMLLASLENDGNVELRHWARGQQIAERWRAGLHSLYEQMNRNEPSEQASKEEKLVQIVGKLGTPTAAEAARYMWGMSSAEAASVLDGLVYAGALKKAEGTRKGTTRYALQ
jgi:hypothetical protein